MANTILKNGIDICKPAPCINEYPEIIVRTYAASVTGGAATTATWDIIANGNLTSNKLVWAENPANLANKELRQEVAGSGVGPYTASFSATGEAVVYFLIEAVIDNFTRRSSVYIVEVGLGLSASA